MRRVIVLAIGNLIMKDDGIGIKVAEYIKNRIEKNDIEVIIGETDFQFCVDKVKEGDFLIIIDAMYIGESAGNINVIPLDIALSNHSKLYSQHEMSLFDSIKDRFRDIKGYLIGIEVAEVDFGLDLSSVLSEKFQGICEKVENEILKIVEGLKNARYSFTGKNI